MKNITLAIEDQVLSEARAFAAKKGTTLNALVRDYLSRIVEEERRMAEHKAKLTELIDNSTGRLGPDYKWNRDELYEERLLPGHKHSDLRGSGKAG